MANKTIAYRMFSSRASSLEPINADDLIKSIPSSNPFLKRLFDSLYDMAGDGPLDLDFDELDWEVYFRC